MKIPLQRKWFIPSGHQSTEGWCWSHRLAMRSGGSLRPRLTAGLFNSSMMVGSRKLSKGSAKISWHMRWHSKWHTCILTWGCTRHCLILTIPPPPIDFKKGRIAHYSPLHFLFYSLLPFQSQEAGGEAGDGQTGGGEWRLTCCYPLLRPVGWRIFIWFVWWREHVPRALLHCESPEEIGYHIGKQARSDCVPRYVTHKGCTHRIRVGQLRGCKTHIKPWFM